MTDARPADRYQVGRRLRGLGLVLGLCWAPAAMAAEWVPGPDTPTLRFSGQTWFVKSADNEPVGPGPNFFAAKNAWVQDGKLHLRVREDHGRWYSAEVVTTASLGFGRYTFTIESDVADLDPNIVLGLFTWADEPDFNHREIDIEVSRWGDARNRNAQCVVQPYGRPGALARFELPGRLKYSEFTFTWAPDQVTCEIAGAGRLTNAPDIPFRFTHRFTDGIPPAGGEHARINLWLVGGRGPAPGNRPREVVLTGFRFTPMSLRR